jgi:hypothetical protein
MVDTFNGVTLNVEAVGPPYEQAADISVRHIPGSAVDYIDVGGVTAPTLTYTLFFARSARRGRW